jgi:hypothetical protein
MNRFELFWEDEGRTNALVGILVEPEGTDTSNTVRPYNKLPIWHVRYGVQF